MNEPIRILHLEDSERDAVLIHDLLEQHGVACDVVRAEGRQAYEAALERGGFDIILSDNNLPDYDGVSALKAARERRPFVPVIVISGSLGEEEAVKCLQFGATDYLLKGRLERLVPAVHRAVAESKERRLRVDAEAELLRNEERMRLALAATNDAIWDWDLTHGRMVCNATFASAFGPLPQSEDPMTWWYTRTHPDERDAVRASLQAAIAAGEDYWAGNYRLLRANGDWSHVHNRACLAKNPAGETTRLIGAIQDITDRINAERELRELEEQLWQAQKMEAIGTLAGGIAHDFNNIIGIILANADLAQQDLPESMPPEHEVRESLREILIATNRATALVKQILTFSRRTEGERQLIKVQPIVQECLKLLRSTIPVMVKIEGRIDPACPSILCDPTQLHQVVMNICTNAWHALPEHDGRIQVGVDECEPAAVLLETHPDLDSGHYVRITIADNGHGMDAKTQARIFEPFFTTKPVGKGTGLGLAVVHGIIRSHGGAITVRSAPGEGTTFEIYFPAQVEGATEVAAVPTGIVRGNGQRILLVDDESSMARVLQRQLNRVGYRARVFHRPELVIEVLRAAPADCDLLITDYAMPGMTGIELAGHVQHLRPGLPVILLSGSMDIEEHRRSRLTGFAAVLTKPVQPVALCAAVDRALQTNPGTS